VRLSTVLPHLANLRVEQVQTAADAITVRAKARGDEGGCPLCGVRSGRVQRRYQRTVADRAVGGRRVVLVLQVRRFVCQNRDCPRRLFAERFPALAAPHARRTLGHQADLRQIGLALGGRAGARLAGRLGPAVSHDTVLRLAAGAPTPDPGTPRVVGIDDFAFRRGLTYGTLIVDLERRRPLDVLPDRAADTVGRWLAARPSIAVVVRDRHDAYATAAAQGAPQARQVVDRFHLLLNLGEAVENVLFTKTAVLRQVHWGDESPETGRPAAPEEPLPPWRQRLAETSQHRHQLRIELYRWIHELHTQGVYSKDIARTLGVGRRTVYRYLHMPEPPPVKQPTRRARQPMLAPYLDYLLRRWGEGCRNAAQLWREIRDQGYPSTQSPVSKLVAGLRHQEPAGLRPVPLPPAKQRLTVRQAGLLFLRHPDDLKPAQRRVLDRLGALDATIAAAYRLAQDFATLVRERQGARLDAWVERAEHADIKHLRGFARGLKDDPAVRAGLSERWSNGQTEGQVNRLKLLKRQAYGRAGFRLLRTRVLAA
jgi:transposase